MAAQKMELVLRMKVKTLKKEVFRELFRGRLTLREYNMNFPLSRASFEISNSSISSCLSTSRDVVDENCKIRPIIRESQDVKSSSLKNFQKRATSITKGVPSGRLFEKCEDSGSREVERAIYFLKNL